MKKENLPSTLAFSRSIEPSEGLMFSVKPDDQFAGLADILEKKNCVVKNVTVSMTTVRGTISHYEDTAPKNRYNKGSKSIEAANIATIERALLAADADHLLIRTQVRFNNNSTTPTMNNSSAFGAHLADFITEYTQLNGYLELATRYVLRLASGSWIWRNLFGENLEIALSCDKDVLLLKEGDVNLSGNNYTLNAFDINKQSIAKTIIEKVAAALSQPGRVCTIDCHALVKLGCGAEVFPSQEFASESTQALRNGSGHKAEKILSKIKDLDGNDIATIHARKIGNAIRTIDTWHGQKDIGAIAIEMFGANTQQAAAHRISDNDFYTYFKKIDELTEQIKKDQQLTGTHHYVVACLIRGGVFGFGSKS